MEVIFNGIKHPEAPFANCFGSYFVSCCNYFGNLLSKDDMMLFLASCSLQYFKLDIDDIMEKFNGNPWGWKPIRLCNSANTPLFESSEAFSECLEFMKIQFGVCTDIIPFEEKTVPMVVSQALLDQKVPIVFIDDFYNSQSEKYKIKHNAHGILVKGMNLTRDKFLVLDMDIPEEYWVPSCELIRFIPQNYSNYLSASYLVLYKSQSEIMINYSEILGTYLLNQSPSLTPLELLARDMKDNLRKNDRLGYYFQGYYFTLLYNVIPFLKMRTHLFSRLDNQVYPTVYENLDENYKRWIIYSETMKKSLMDDLYTEDLISQLNNLIEEEREIEQIKLRLRGNQVE